VKEARDAWFGKFADVALADLVFLDEFGATTDMTRTHGRGPVGERVVCAAPHGHWKCLTAVAAMTLAGVVTSCVFDGPVDTDLFVAFVGTFLVPQLRPGQVVVFDNLSPHRSPRVTAAVEAAGCRVVRLPPYSPDFNPIEMAIHKVKALLRKEEARTVDALVEAIGRGVASVTPQDAEAFMRHCGYSATGGRNVL
jgi:transposase